MGTTVGGAIDYLVTLFGNGFTGVDPYQRPVSVQSLTAINSGVEIADTMPTTDGGAWVVVGREGEETDSQIAATAQYQVLGRQRITESYTVPGMILVYGQGPDYKPTRDQAIALFDGITKLIWADPTMNGLLQDGRIGMVSQFTLGQPDQSTDAQFSSGGGVAVTVSFGVQVENSYVP